MLDRTVIRGTDPMVPVGGWCLSGRRSVASAGEASYDQRHLCRVALMEAAGRERAGAAAGVTITVTGVGRVAIRPDVADVRVGATVAAETAAGPAMGRGGS